MDLGSAIADLENDRGRHLLTLKSILLGGPMFCSAAAYDALGAWTSDQVALVRAELLAFFRSIVGTGGTERFSAGIGTYHAMTFSAITAGAGVYSAADGDVRDLLVFQVVMMLQTAGLSSVRACVAPDCGRLFFRRYRREYCSRRCQNRVFMRHQRAETKAEEQRYARRRGRHG